MNFNKLILCFFLLLIGTSYDEYTVLNKQELADLKEEISKARAEAAQMSAEAVRAREAFDIASRQAILAIEKAACTIAQVENHSTTSQ